MLKSVLLPMTVVAVTATAAAMTAGQDEKVVPVHQEPRHHLVFDSDAIRVLDIQIPPGDTTLFHTHSNPILYVNMSSSQTRGQTLGREWSGEGTARPAPAAGATPAPGAPVPAGSPPAVFGRMNSVTSYSTQPLTHRVNNVGTGVFRLIGVINRGAGDERTEPSPDFAAKPEVDNRWFRGYRWLLEPKPSADHRHANPVAIVLVKGRALVKAGKDRPLDALGSFTIVEPGTAHTVQGIGSETAGADANQVVEIEVRTTFLIGRLLTSFIVPAHNEEGLLAATLAAIHTAARAAQLDYEIIVVDDASTDRTAEIARAHDAQVCAVSLRQISAVRNAGARAARGEWLIFVDADTVVTPQVVSAACAAMTSGVVGGGANVEWEGDLPVWARMLAKGTLLTMRIATLAAGCFVFCTRPAFAAAGGFDETVFATEELWFSKALKRHGRFVILREHVVTSSRKLRTYTGLEVVTMTLPLFYRGLAVFRDRRYLGLWYGDRRRE